MTYTQVDKKKTHVTPKTAVFTFLMAQSPIERELNANSHLDMDQIQAPIDPTYFIIKSPVL